MFGKTVTNTCKKCGYVQVEHGHSLFITLKDDEGEFVFTDIACEKCGHVNLSERKLKAKVHCVMLA